MMLSMRRFLNDFWERLPINGLGRPPNENDPDLPPAKVAIIGAGMGGCFAAKFLREKGGENLDIHVFAKKGSKVGGRVGVCQFDGHMYETGAVIFIPEHKYLADAAKQHDLTIKEDLVSAVGFFDGEAMFQVGKKKSVPFVRHYGIDFLRLFYFVFGVLKKLCNIYRLQENGEAYANVEDMFAAMGQEMRDLIKVSARDYMRNNLHLSERLINQLVTGIVRSFFAQGASANAFTAAVVLFMAGSKNLSVVGGNHRIAECVLEESGSSLVMEDVVSVTKSEKDGAVKYAITTGDGKTDEGYDVVIVANPLNTSTIKYENFSRDVYAKATTPYQRTTVTLCKGKINQNYFRANANNAKFPQVIFNTAITQFDFSGIEVAVPSEVHQNEARRYKRSLRDDPVKVWKVYSPEPLTQDLCQALFPETHVGDMVCVDWLAAYPRHIEPYNPPSFILDDGVFYINAIEMATSGMEGSAIGAKNAALLTRNYLLQHN